MDITKIKTDKTLRIKKFPATLKPDFPPKDFQHPGIMMMYLVSKMVLGYDVGLGKTYVTLAAFSLMKAKLRPTAQLIVITISSSMYQWQGDIEKFTNFSCFVIDAKVMKPDERIDFYENRFKDYDIIIMPYSLMMKDVLYFDSNIAGNVLAFDEVMKLKNEKAAVYGVAKYVINKTDRAYGLTATVMDNSLEEPYAIFKLFAPKLMPSTHKFLKDFCIRDKKRIGKRVINITTDYKNIPGFFKLFEPAYISCKKHEVPEHLPEIEHKIIVTKMLPKQRELYRQALEDFLDIDADKDLITSLTRIIRCVQISNYPNVLGYEVPSSKEIELLAMLEDDDIILPQDKVVIYTKSRKGVDWLCDNILTKYNPLRIHGKVKPQDRLKAQEVFDSDPTRRIIVINSAASVAVNLQTASTLVQYDMEWSYGGNHQLIGRLNRLNSKHAINRIYSLQNWESIDAYIYRAVLIKQGYFEALLGGYGYEMSKGDFTMFVQNFKDFVKRYKNY